MSYFGITLNTLIYIIDYREFEGQKIVGLAGYPTQNLSVNSRVYYAIVLPVHFLFSISPQKTYLKDINRLKPKESLLALCSH